MVSKRPLSITTSKLSSGKFISLASMSWSKYQAIQEKEAGKWSWTLSFKISMHVGELSIFAIEVYPSFSISVLKADLKLYPKCRSRYAAVCSSA